MRKPWTYEHGKGFRQERDVSVVPSDVRPDLAVTFASLRRGKTKQETDAYNGLKSLRKKGSDVSLPQAAKSALTQLNQQRFQYNLGIRQARGADLQPAQDSRRASLANSPQAKLITPSEKVKSPPLKAPRSHK
jgi:hypothetical protein